MDSRLSQGRAGAPTAGDPLRFGFTPPSLHQLRRRRRAERHRLVARLLLLLLAILTISSELYPWPSAPALASAATPVTSPSAEPLASSTGHQAPAFVAANADIPGASSGDASGEVAPPPATPTAVAPTATPRPAPSAAAGAHALTRARAIPPTPTAAPDPPLDAAGLAGALTAITTTTDGTYGITVIDLRSGQVVDLNATRPMVAASVNKLEILAALYHEVEQGQLSLDQTLRTTEDDIQDYGTGVIRYQPVGTAYTLGDLAKLLVEQSDNTASYMLAQTVGLSTIEALVRSWGLGATRVGDDISSPHDAAVLLALLYRGSLANPTDTAKMIEYLSHTAWNDRIPAGVPSTITVAHKIGNQVNVVNDTGIVYLPGRPYVLSIFTADVNLDRAVAVEQQLSRTVYAYERQAGGAG